MKLGKQYGRCLIAGNVNVKFEAMNIREKIEYILAEDYGCFDDKTIDKLLSLHSVSKRALLTEKQAKISCKLCNGKGHLNMRMEDGLYYVIDCPKCIAEI